MWARVGGAGGGSSPRRKARGDSGDSVASCSSASTAFSSSGSAAGLSPKQSIVQRGVMGPLIQRASSGSLLPRLNPLSGGLGRAARGRRCSESSARSSICEPGEWSLEHEEAFPGSLDCAGAEHARKEHEEEHEDEDEDEDEDDDEGLDDGDEDEDEDDLCHSDEDDDESDSEDDEEVAATKKVRRGLRNLFRGRFTFKLKKAGECSGGGRAGAGAGAGADKPGSGGPDGGSPVKHREAKQASGRLGRRLFVSGGRLSSSSGGGSSGSSGSSTSSSGSTSSSNNSSNSNSNSKDAVGETECSSPNGTTGKKTGLGKLKRSSTRARRRQAGGCEGGGPEPTNSAFAQVLVVGLCGMTLVGVGAFPGSTRSALQTALAVLCCAFAYFYASTAMGWVLSKVLTRFVLHGFPLRFGTFSVAPSIYKGRLNLKVCAEDVGFANPVGFPHKWFLHCGKTELVLALPLRELPRILLCRARTVPLKRQKDFQCLAIFEVPYIEFDSFSLNFELSDGKFNINELGKELAEREVYSFLLWEYRKARLAARWQSAKQGARAMLSARAWMQAVKRRLCAEKPAEPQTPKTIPTFASSTSDRTLRAGETRWSAPAEEDCEQEDCEQATAQAKLMDVSASASSSFGRKPRVRRSSSLSQLPSAAELAALAAAQAQADQDQEDQGQGQAVDRVVVGGLHEQVQALHALHEGEEEDEGENLSCSSSSGEKAKARPPPVNTCRKQEAPRKRLGSGAAFGSMMLPRAPRSPLFSGGSPSLRLRRLGSSAAVGKPSLALKTSRWLLHHPNKGSASSGKTVAAAAAPPQVIDPDKVKMPNRLEVTVVRCRGLVAKDRSLFSHKARSSDPVVTVKLRDQSASTAVRYNTLKPMYNETFCFNVTDPSTVLHVQVKDQDIISTGDFLGQWIMTLKYLILDPTYCWHTPEGFAFERKNGADVSMRGWFPLMSRRWDRLNRIGEVELKLRWHYTPDLPSVYTPPVRSAMASLDSNSRENQLRMGNRNRVNKMLNRIPVLFNIKRVNIHKVEFFLQDLFRGTKGAAEELALRGKDSDAASKIKIATLAWHTAFRPPKNQPGITVYKVCYAFFVKGLMPKVFNQSILGSALSQTTMGFAANLKSGMENTLNGAHTESIVHFFNGHTVTKGVKRGIGGTSSIIRAYATHFKKKLQGDLDDTHVTADDDEFLKETSLEGYLEKGNASSRLTDLTRNRIRATGLHLCRFEMKARTLFYRPTSDSHPRKIRMDKVQLIVLDRDRHSIYIHRANKITVLRVPAPPPPKRNAPDAARTAARQADVREQELLCWFAALKEVGVNFTIR